MYQITVMGCCLFSQDQAEQTDCVEVCNDTDKKTYNIQVPRQYCRQCAERHPASSLDKTKL